MDDDGIIGDVIDIGVLDVGDDVVEFTTGQLVRTSCVELFVRFVATDMILMDMFG